MTQHPKLRGQLPGSMLDLLNAALESSRRALNLKQDDADTLLYASPHTPFPSHDPRQGLI